MSRVIRGAGPPARVVPSGIVEARNDAEQRLADARDEAARIVTEARAEAARLTAEAKVEGAAAARADAAGMLLAAAQIRDAALARAERETRALALGVASRIVGEAIALEPARIDALVRAALARTRRATTVDVRVHPEDARALDLGPGVRVVTDPTLRRGGCVVSSELGTVDARVEVQLDALADLLDCAPWAGLDAEDGE